MLTTKSRVDEEIIYRITLSLAGRLPELRALYDQVKACTRGEMPILKAEITVLANELERAVQMCGSSSMKMPGEADSDVVLPIPSEKKKETERRKID